MNKHSARHICLIYIPAAFWIAAAVALYLE